MTAKKVRRNRTTGRCNPVWEELKIGLQRKIPARITSQVRAAAMLWFNHVVLGAERGLS